MSESTKSAVLTKCQDAIKESKYASDNDADWDLRREDDGFRLEAWNGTLSMYFCEDDSDAIEVWHLAAEILGITPTVDEFEAATTARQYAHDLEQARKEGYEAGKAATIWPAYLAAATRFVGVAGINILNIEELAKAEFDKWVKTLPPDGLQADRELVAKYPIKFLSYGFDRYLCFVLDRSETRMVGYHELKCALKRLCRLEVGNGQK